ncbi:phosphorelay sensor kinase [Aureococcus anophagefferens]|nr:phosphorelay sensor kinase [Aureococcus anophagefferens]
MPEVADPVAGTQLQHVRLPAAEVMKQWRAAGSPKDKVAEINMTTPIENSAQAITGVLMYTAVLGPDADIPTGFLSGYQYAGFKSGAVLVDDGSFVFDTQGHDFVQPVTPVSRGAGTFFDVDSGELPGVTCGAVGVYCCAAYGPNGTVAAENSTTPCSTLVRDAVYGLVYRRTIVSLVPDDEQA